MPLNICVVEADGHVAPGAAAECVAALAGTVVQTSPDVPRDLAGCDVIVLNSVSVAADRSAEIVTFVERGGGLLAIHDSVFPYGAGHELINAVGIRPAYDAVQPIWTGHAVEYQVLLARADPRDPMQSFPVAPTIESVGHPIVEGVAEFEIADEVWAQNLATGVRPLLSVAVGDRIPAHQRFKQPIPVCACKVLGSGRTAFFSLGHFGATYGNEMVRRIIANAVAWVGKRTNEDRYAYDLFLSFSSSNRDEARQIYEAAAGMGLRIFMDERAIGAGDAWSEGIREALVGSRELAVLASPQSLESEWVTTEWGSPGHFRSASSPYSSEPI